VKKNRELDKVISRPGYQGHEKRGNPTIANGVAMSDKGDLALKLDLPGTGRINGMIAKEKSPRLPPWLTQRV